MATARSAKPIEADDAEPLQHITDAELPALLITFAHLTGDESLLTDSPRPEIALTGAPQGGYDES